MSPHFHTVSRNVEGDITEDLEAQTIDITLQAVPLLPEEPLRETDIVDLVLMFGSKFPQACRLMAAKPLIRPAVPGQITELLSDTDEIGIIPKPIRGLHKCSDLVHGLGSDLIVSEAQIALTV